MVVGPAFTDPIWQAATQSRQEVFWDVGRTPVAAALHRLPVVARDLQIQQSYKHAFSPAPWSIGSSLNSFYEA